MVGSVDAALARLESGDRASWHFSVTKTGKVLQHYDSSAVCWHAGTRLWNGRVIGIEHEGGPPDNESEPLTDAQRGSSVALVRWLSHQHFFPLVRGVGLFEHNELGYATACPSRRIPWDFYTEEEDMKPFLCWNLDRQGVFLVGPFGAAWITDANDVKTLEGQYGKTTIVLHDSTIKSIAAKVA